MLEVNGSFDDYDQMKFSFYTHKNHVDDVNLNYEYDSGC